MSTLKFPRGQLTLTLTLSPKHATAWLNDRAGLMLVCAVARLSMVACEPWSKDEHLLHIGSAAFLLSSREAEQVQQAIARAVSPRTEALQ